MDGNQIREMRDRFDQVEDLIHEVRAIVTSMQLSDAEARGDVKAVVGKLDNASTALANAAQSLQILQMRVSETPKDAAKSSLDVWLLRIILALVAVIAGMAGVKVLPSLFGVGH